MCAYRSSSRERIQRMRLLPSVSHLSIPSACPRHWCCALLLPRSRRLRSPRSRHAPIATRPVAGPGGSVQCPPGRPLGSWLLGGAPAGHAGSYAPFPSRHAMWGFPGQLPAGRPRFDARVGSAVASQISWSAAATATAATTAAVTRPLLPLPLLPLLLSLLLLPLPLLPLLLPLLLSTSLYPWCSGHRAARHGTPAVPPRTSSAHTAVTPNEHQLSTSPTTATPSATLRTAADLPPLACRPAAAAGLATRAASCSRPPARPPPRPCRREPDAPAAAVPSSSILMGAS